ncbi:MAG: hypothetical protein RLZZ338_243 [Cyanobacteriota bacterium]|jgi:pimeloyl-ACP methyl ester carboxylesterase
MSDFDPHDFNNLLKTSVNTGIITPTQGIIPQLEANRTLTGVGSQEVKAQSLTPDTSDNIILGDASQTKMTNGTITDTNTSLPDSAVDLITGQAMSEVYGDLSKFAAESDFVGKMNLAFEENWDAVGAKALAEGWFNRDFSAIPPVKVVSSAEIGGANGAFAAATDTIYLSKEFLAQNGANPVAIADVLLEEIGHSVDARLNVKDTPGDEGAIFAAVVQGKELSQSELQGLRGEDDRATVFLDGQTISIEKADDYYDQNWGGEIFDWSSGQKESKGWYPFTRNDGDAISSRNAISRNWRDGNPGISNGVLGSDKFGVNFYTKADFEAGKTYYFSVTADDYYKIGAIPVNGNQWANISGQDWKWLNDAYGGKKYTFTPETTGKYWVYAGYIEKDGAASFSLSWDKAITVENQTFPVELSLYDKDGKKGIANRSNIDPNKDTVVVIHGRGSGGEDGNIINLARKAAESQYYPNSQVLYLDWKEAANDPGNLLLGTVPYDAAKRIRPVAQWATNRLKELGIASGKTILLGHSLGSYVASEIGKISGGVKELVALDPASSPNGTYDIDGNNPKPDRTIEFSKAATKSTALVVSDADSVGGAAGDNERASSANDSYIVYFTGYEEHGDNAKDKTVNKIADYHNGVVNIFSEIMLRDFDFPSHQQDRFDAEGHLLKQEFQGKDAFDEGVITATFASGINGLYYVNPNGEVKRTWNS